ncbi:MAG: thrombospondin type 3 repeat-containing protein, partial [Akkermansiaceae bacterium]
MPLRSTARFQKTPRTSPFAGPFAGSLIALALGGLAPSQALAQALRPPDPEAEVTLLNPDLHALVWQGHPGNTYFIQTASGPSPEGTLRWEYIPDIRQGNGQRIGMGFEIETTNTNQFYRFYRLQYTQRTPVIDHNLDDFDGDGFTNLEEVLEDTNPLDASHHPAIEDEDSNPQGGGSGSGGGSGNGEDSSAPSFQLIHIVDGFSITHVINSHNPVPPFAIFRKTDLLNELKLVAAPSGTILSFLQIIPNDDY